MSLRWIEMDNKSSAPISSNQFSQISCKSYEFSSSLLIKSVARNIITLFFVGHVLGFGYILPVNDLLLIKILNPHHPLFIFIYLFYEGVKL